jgi:hypothetical protein
MTYTDRTAAKTGVLHRHGLTDADKAIADLQKQIDALKSQSTAGTDTNLRKDVDFLMNIVCPPPKAP